jgi:hypothetical protein
MKNVELVPFKTYHVNAFDDNEGELVYLGDGLEDSLQLNANEGPGYTGLYKDSVIGCGGVRLFWKGVGEAWGIYPGSFHRNIREVFYYTKTMLGVIIEKNDLRRVQATARADLPCTQNWLRHLGFKIEGRMNNYCPSGHDTFLYSITRK